MSNRLKLKVRTKIPAALLEGTGIGITKDGLKYTIGLDYSNLQETDTFDPEFVEVAIWNPHTDEWARISLTDFVNGSFGSSTAGYHLQTNGVGSPPTWVGFTQSGTGAVSRTWQNKARDIVSVKDFGATGDGVTNDTAAINAAETALSATAGVLVFPAGTYMVSGVTKKSNTIWVGAGIGNTVIKLIGGTTTNAVIAGVNAYSLFGTGSIIDFIQSFSIRDMTIDGNRAGGGVSDGIGLYACNFSLRDVEIQNCARNGLRTEMGPSAAPSPHYNVQSWFSNLEVHSCTLTGFVYAGPTDSVIENCNFFYCLEYGIWTKGTGTGKFSRIHTFGDAVGGLGQSVVGIRCDSPLNILTDCVFEGSTAYQVWFRAGLQLVKSCIIFYNQTDPGTQAGIKLGDSTGAGGSVTSSGSNFIDARIDNCKGGAIIFDADTGQNVINVIGANQMSGSTGYFGSPGATSRIRLNVTGPSVANGTLNTEGLAIGFAGLLTPGAGLGGVVDGSNAAAGVVGEYISSTIAIGSASARTTGVAANVTSISLTAGDWDVSGLVTTTVGGTTTTTSLSASISTVSATVGQFSIVYPSNVAGATTSLPTPTVRLSLSVTTTVYLVANAQFLTSTLSTYGFISARRVR